MQTTGWEIWKSLIGPLFAVVLGYVVSAFNKVSKADFQKAVADVNGHWAEKYAALEKQLERQNERNSKFEAALNDKVSRSELKDAVSELKATVTEFRSEWRDEFKQLREMIAKS